MNIEKQRYIERAPGILEPRHKEELFALLQDPCSKAPVDHPLFTRSRKGIKILHNNISERTGVINDKFEQILFPAKAMEHFFKHELTLHHQYNIPRGFDPYWFESFCRYMLRARDRKILMPMTRKQVLCLWQELVFLNPGLNTFTPNISPDTIYHILYGIGSQFTIDDIWYFVFDRYPAGGIASHSNNMHDLLKKVSGTYGSKENWGYVPSPHTLNKVERHLGLPETVFPSLD